MKYVQIIIIINFTLKIAQSCEFFTECYIVNTLLIISVLCVIHIEEKINIKVKI